ncbi:MAG: hypothetical protein JXO22_04315 [Phycisphaerae bacterium]|nr:hypothetical protein [Phycisphaerae bacterium]
MAGVIKRERYTTGSAFSFRDLEADAECIITKARADADEILRVARENAKAEIVRQAKQEMAEGRAAGRAAGLTEIKREAQERILGETRAEVTAAVQSLVAGLQEFEQCKRRLLAQAEIGLVDLAMAIARRVCKSLGEASNDVAVANARHLLETVGPQSDLELHVHPDEHGALTKWAAEFVAACDELEHVSVVADASVARGGCVLRGRQVVIDATLDTQLDRIAATICSHETSDTAEAER